jgi:HlyD family secretion protein
VKKAIVFFVIIAVLVGIVIYAYVSKGGASGTGGPGDRQISSVPVETMKVVNGDIAKKVVATGAIEALAQVEVYPKQSGEIIELMADTGYKVKAGQTLAKIESDMLKIQLKQAEADLASSKAAYEKAASLSAVSSETDFEQAKSNVDRLQSVLKQAELDLQLQEKQADVQVKRAEADLRIAEARLDAALSGAREQELEQAKVRVENSKRNLERLESLLEEQMISQDQVEAAQLQYDIYNAQLSLLEEGIRPEDMEVLKAQVETAKASLETAENNKLLVDIKRSDLEAVKAQLSSAEASFKQAMVSKDASTWEKDLAQVKASLQRSEAALEMSQQHLDDTTIKSPIDGIIAERYLDKGDMASPNRPFVTIVDMDIIKILAKVPARDIVDIKVGDTAVIKPDVYSNESFTGKVTKISPVIDRASQTSDIEVEAPNPDYKLKPGMFTSVEMTVRENKNVPIIPIEALVREGGEDFVYVIEDGKAASKKVTIGINDSIKLEVLSGLKAGDEFIMAGKYNLRPGMSVVKTQGSGLQGDKPQNTEQRKGA